MRMALALSRCVKHLKACCSSGLRYVTQKDFHLAKRYYDMAFQTNREAYIPVLLSLTKLYARSLWHTLSGGKEKSLTLWADDSEEDHWYLGKAKEEFKKRWRGKKSDQRSELGSGRDGAENKDGEAQPTAGGGQQQRPVPDDDDPIQWAQNRRQEESRVDDEGAYIPGDYFSGDGYGGGGGRGATPEEEDVDEFWETVFLLGLCLAISGLVYLRGRWMTEQARRQAAEAERANGGGNPPAPPPEPPLQQVPRGVGGDVLPDIGLLRQDQVDGTDGL
jgi:SEL1 protein